MLNNCSKEDLIALPCIDNIMADKIMKRRKNCRPFESVESFFRIMGFSDYQKTVFKGKNFCRQKE
jgi:DNA uptake protein ComE-like DNA-binding protein